MSVPILVVTGFLGAGKTTFINTLLQSDHGLRIAAIVNDFGSINIDATLIGASAEGVIGLKNGCICCSLQGDLLRTLRTVMRQTPVPELIVVEASGVADPTGIIQSLMDPVIWQSARLQTVIGVVDATDAPHRMEDPLWQTQVRGSDVLLLAKGDCTTTEALSALRSRLSVAFRKTILDLSEAPSISALLELQKANRSFPSTNPVPDNRFAHAEWIYEGAIDLGAFQKVMGQLAPGLLRAKGFIRFKGQADMMLFQLSGNRATLARAEDGVDPVCRLVLIAERDKTGLDEAIGLLRRLET